MKLHTLFAVHGWPMLLIAALFVLLFAGRPTPARGGGAGGAGGGLQHLPRPQASSPGPTIDAHVRPGFAERMRWLRPTILAAARRHNRPALSGMSDAEFAATIATILYNENFGWLEDDVPPLQVFTPLYQDLQRQVNTSPFGGDLTVWPANLRPSVALEILRREVPLPENQLAYAPIRVAGSRINPAAYTDRLQLYAAITAEISRDDLAVAYLAANLERGLYRAAFEEVPVSWRTLAAWHNQGIVDPRQIRANPTARDYVRRASAYLPLAQALVSEVRAQKPDVTGGCGRPLTQARCPS